MLKSPSLLKKNMTEKLLTIPEKLELQKWHVEILFLHELSFDLIVKELSQDIMLSFDALLASLYYTLLFVMLSCLSFHVQFLTPNASYFWFLLCFLILTTSCYPESSLCQRSRYTKSFWRNRVSGI